MLMNKNPDLKQLKRIRKVSPEIFLLYHRWINQMNIYNPKY